ncbi:MAG: hypothetical protein J6L00_05415, partial [Clostridia bacterium]|nr:hypothetical protein [Clostridia bacterium]
PSKASVDGVSAKPILHLTRGGKKKMSAKDKRRHTAFVYLLYFYPYDHPPYGGCFLCLHHTQHIVVFDRVRHCIFGANGKNIPRNVLKYGVSHGVFGRNAVNIDFLPVKQYIPMNFYSSTIYCALGLTNTIYDVTIISAPTK